MLPNTDILAELLQGTIDSVKHVADHGSGCTCSDCRDAVQIIANASQYLAQISDSQNTTIKASK